ncbi:hypothetical protein BFJ63_vAg17731 [Fusarium oxysporum f. sp. narcissi]|uniref:HAT C-terminal dimerisation domain-containing protein n=1 Tax=Fusarium oxysporum f. sp. narcissi TaxID=451672 RepID=A0A4Q2UZ46_FUSOX|nr:hypothetical protein BFJ63_vAg17731 [Fusarium oxysporum f. sp. narcissi]
MVADVWLSDYAHLEVRTSSSRGDDEPPAKRPRFFNLFEKNSRVPNSKPAHAAAIVSDEYQAWQTDRDASDGTVRDPIGYWITKQSRYPQLSRMALDFLTIQPMSAEYAKIIAICQVLRSWYRAGLIKDLDPLLKSHLESKHDAGCGTLSDGELALAETKWLLEGEDSVSEVDDTSQQQRAEDQPFWGQMVANAGAGPIPIPHAELTADNLSEAIRYCLSQEAAAAAASIAAKMASEEGVRAAVQSFHRQLPLERIPCGLISSEPATWLYSKSKHLIKLSKVAAEILVSTKSIEAKHLKLYQSNPIFIETTRWDPISGGASAVMATATGMAGSITGMVTKPVEEYRDEKQRRARELKRAQARGSPSIQEKARDGGQLMPDRLSDDSMRPKSEHSGSLAGRMAGASAKSIGKIGPTALKGMVVDIPLALTEGLKSVPQHYGGSVRDHGPVTDVKSGIVVAGKAFAWGFIDGLSDVVTQPYKGARKEGAMGAVKGVGKGVMSLATKSGAGMFGVFAYPSAGISKSLRTAVHGSTRKAIAQERREEGVWMAKNGAGTQIDWSEVVSRFESLKLDK